jgi:arabinofuranan 3-O-arabinosyltransferase
VTSAPDDPPDFLDRAYSWLTARRTRYALCWIVCLFFAGQRWYHARYEFDSGKYAEPEKQRADTNNGHTHIDFGGQWVFGRLAATGQFRDLYHRDAQWQVVNEAYPADRQSDAQRRYSFPSGSRPTTLSADDVRTDAEYLMGCLMGNEVDRRRANAAGELVGAGLAGAFGDNPLAAAAGLVAAGERFPPEVAEQFGHPVRGGPLYPPVHAFLYAPLGAISDPQTAYFTFQWVSLAAAFLCGWCVTVLSGGRIWWPVAAAVILIYPGGRPGLDLAQNHYLTLLIVLGGWTLAAKGYETTGGAVWGLLAFKPVWGLAFILAPLLMRRWRFVLGTGVCGLSLVLMTLPFVGVQGWQDWWEVGQLAKDKYKVDENWTNLSRDVYGLTRRFTLDFSKPADVRNTLEAETASLASLGAVIAGTVAVYLWRGNRRYFTGLSAGFLLFGCYLCCYRFMYYDAMVSVAGFAALLANPAWTLTGPQGNLTRPIATRAAGRRLRLFTNSFPLTVLVLLLVNDNVLIGLNPQVTAGFGRWASVVTDQGGKETTVTPKVTAAADYNHPIDTLLVAAVWAWCGWRLIRDGRRADDESVYAGLPSNESSAEPMSGDRMSDSPTSTA